MTPTEIWGPELYGDPCRQCGFDWSISTEDAIGIVAGFSHRFTELLGENAGSISHPELSWSAAAYVSHVADNLWIWAQRLSGARLSGVLEVPGYDQDLLAQARNYNENSTGAALWALSTASDLWQESVNAALAGHVVLNHATVGRMTTADVIRAASHDGNHHVWDVERIVAYSKA
ncbi:MAG: hypothetical protein Q7K25_06930 [Actinomycetota bacterium]|nr:hypothetical protein [Actinomycetota bacterium]